MGEVKCRVGRAARSAGFSLAELAEMCGIAAEELLEWEAGRRAPGLDAALCVAEALRRDVSEAFSLVEAGGRASLEEPGNVACHLLEVRRGLRVAQKDLAASSGLANKTVQRIERGERVPPLWGALSIAEALGVDASDVFRRRRIGGYPAAANLVDMRNRRVGRLVVMSRDLEAPSRKVKWLCRCDCGRVVSVRGSDLRGGRTRSCGCAVEEGRDLRGLRFGMLTVVERTSPTCREGRDHQARHWLCVCDCGGTAIVRRDRLISGHTRSCGCELPQGLSEAVGRRRW